MSSIYIETSIVSHAAAWRSSDLNVAALQAQARDWWRTERSRFDLVTLQLVLNEASAGDPGAATERMKLLAGIPLVPITEEVREIARELISPSVIPVGAAADALHVAAAACAGVEYLLTLNCRHIANAHILPRVYSILGTHGFGGLLICTPAEFLGDRYDDKEPDT